MTQPSWAALCKLSLFPSLGHRRPPKRTKAESCSRSRSAWGSWKTALLKPKSVKFSAPEALRLRSLTGVNHS
jgi:hypothetical protein